MALGVWKTEYTKLMSCSGMTADWFSDRLNDMHTFFVGDENDRQLALKEADAIKDQETKEEVREILQKMELEVDYSFF